MNKQQIMNAMIFKIKQALDVYENITPEDFSLGKDIFARHVLHDCIILATGNAYDSSYENFKQIMKIQEELLSTLTQH